MCKNKIWGGSLWGHSVAALFTVSLSLFWHSRDLSPWDLESIDTSWDELSSCPFQLFLSLVVFGIFDWLCHCCNIIGRSGLLALAFFPVFVLSSLLLPGFLSHFFPVFHCLLPGFCVTTLRWRTDRPSQMTWPRLWRRSRLPGAVRKKSRILAAPGKFPGSPGKNSGKRPPRCWQSAPWGGRTSCSLKRWLRRCRSCRTEMKGCYHCCNKKRALFNYLFNRGLCTCYSSVP